MMVLPVAFMLLRLALMAKGDMKSLSNDRERAISASELAVICNLTGSVTPSICNLKNNLRNKKSVLYATFYLF